MVDIPPDDGFKWFGEGFDGFPRRLPDDCVDYAVHILDSAFTTDNQIRERLRAFEKAAKDYVKKHLKEYIWQRDPFRLELTREDNTWLLREQTNYGDSVADEWVIVHVLRETSKAFPEAWVRVSDTDGEFLLIEAANALPRWLKPEVAENRVWINRGRLLIIPLQASAKSASAPLSLPLARRTILTAPDSLLHIPAVESEAFHRIRHYADNPSLLVSDNTHTALLILPRRAAWLLHQNPNYVSPAVEAFYLRDPISLRPLRNASTTNNPTTSSTLTKPTTTEEPSSSSSTTLLFPPTDFTTAPIRFAKPSFAQLRSQIRFEPPPIWADALAQLRTNNNDSNSNNLHQPDGNDAKIPTRLDDGMKLTLGLEMLLHDPDQRDRPAVREMRLLLEDLAADEEEGAASLPTDAEIRETWGSSEDPEDWLDVGFEDLERELRGKEEKAGSSSTAAAEWGDRRAQENLQRMVRRFEEFLGDEAAGLEGMGSSDDDDGDEEWGSDEDMSDDEGVAGGTPQFDEQEFIRMMSQMMGRPVPASSSKVQEVTEEEEEDAEEIDHNPDDADDIAAIRDLSARMEAELNAHGALDLDPSPHLHPRPLKAKAKPTKTTSKESGKQNARDDDEEEEEANASPDEDAAVNVDFHLAKNLLESLKGQAGLAGPAGNMMGLMGIRFPRDADEGVDATDATDAAADDGGRRAEG